MRNVDDVVNDNHARMLYFSGVKLIQMAFELTDAQATKLTLTIAAELLREKDKENEK